MAWFDGIFRSADPVLLDINGTQASFGKSADIAKQIGADKAAKTDDKVQQQLAKSRESITKRQDTANARVQNSTQTMAQQMASTSPSSTVEFPSQDEIQNLPNVRAALMSEASSPDKSGVNFAPATISNIMVDDATLPNSPKILGSIGNDQSHIAIDGGEPLIAPATAPILSVSSPPVGASAPVAIPATPLSHKDNAGAAPVNVPLTKFKADPRVLNGKDTSPDQVAGLKEFLVNNPRTIGMSKLVAGGMAAGAFSSLARKLDEDIALKQAQGEKISAGAKTKQVAAHAGTWAGRITAAAGAVQTITGKNNSQWVRRILESTRSSLHRS